MAKRYLINIFLLIAVLCGFSSCEEDPYYDPYEDITTPAHTHNGRNFNIRTSDQQSIRARTPVIYHL